MDLDEIRRERMPKTFVDGRAPDRYHTLHLREWRFDRDTRLLATLATLDAHDAVWRRAAEDRERAPGCRPQISCR